MPSHSPKEDVRLAGLRTKTERFLASFQAVEIRPEHRNFGNEGPCLRDCGIPSTVASQLIHWAEHCGESLTVTFEYRNTGRVVACWCWEPSFLQAAFVKHTDLFGEEDLPLAARRMRDTGTCFSA